MVDYCLSPFLSTEFAILVLICLPFSLYMVCQKRIKAGLLLSLAVKKT